MQPSVADKIKVWAFPGLISILSAVIWQDVNEIKADVKALIAQSSADKARIDNLEKQVDNINNKLFMGAAASVTIPAVPGKSSNVPVYFYQELYVASYDSKKQLYAKQTSGASF